MSTPMDKPKPKPKGLSALLRSEADKNTQPSTPVRHDHPYYDGRFEAFVESADIAEPFEARRLALEKVAEAAKDYMVPTYGSYRRLMEALAAVPPLPEVHDGN